MTFNDLSARRSVHSSLDLVRLGYIDPDFSLCGAQIHGVFTGVDVATFIVQSVRPNIKVVDYLLEHNDFRVRRVARNIATNHDSRAPELLPVHRDTARSNS